MYAIRSYYADVGDRAVERAHFLTQASLRLAALFESASVLYGRADDVGERIKEGEVAVRKSA